MLEYKVWAYAILVKAGVYILEEAQRTSQTQQLVEKDYILPVSQKLLVL